MAGENKEEEMLQTVEGEASDVTDYERARLERIKRNRDMLANLQVPEIATALEPVPKKPKSQTNKGKEKLDAVYSRRATRLSTRTKTPTKIVDWSTDGSDDVAPSGSDSEGAFFPKASAKKKGKAVTRKEVRAEDEFPEKKQNDDEYEPSGGSESDQEEEADEPDDDEELVQRSTKKKGKSSRSFGKKAKTEKLSFRLQALSSPGVSSKEGDTDGEHLELEQALQLSMEQGENKEESRLTNPYAKGAGASKLRKRRGGRELKFTQSEVDSYFVSIAGSEVGAISLKLLENAALSQDFIWSEQELQDMIDVFDENDDGFLSLSEFRAMVARCKMMEAS
ncbi:hypothetical protein Mapa_014304 [Marchantia paleacea]|nr:hypothetical protein Mapa_014304 [Marchantia paleacea]